MPSVRAEPYPLPRRSPPVVKAAGRITMAAGAIDLEPKRASAGTAAQDADGVAFEQATAGWTDLLLNTVGADNSKFGALEAGCPSEGGFGAGVRAVLAGKPASTLLKRLGALRRYGKHCATEGLRAYPLEEGTAYSYLRRCAADGGATSGSSFRSAVAFGHGFFGLCGAEAVLASRRCSGAMYSGLSKKAPVERAPPLTVDQVKMLELALETSADPRDAALAGLCLFCVHGRLRVGDAVRIQAEPFLDDPGLGRTAFLEAGTQNHKTAPRGARDLLPLVALARGITNPRWAEDWLRARDAAGLDALRDGCLQPAVGRTGGWSRARSPVSAVTAWLRGYLGDASLSARSLKPTVLSWAAKHGGVSKAARRMLGYHVKPGDRTLTIYSRSELAVPLRDLEKVYLDIEGGRFNPDASRSGAWASNAPVPLPLAEPCSPEDSDDSSSSSSSAVSVATVVPDAPQDSAPKVFALNVRTGIVHLDGDGAHTACGRALPRQLSLCSTYPSEALGRCSRCFSR